MVTCSAYNCTNRTSKKIPGVTFHRFPNDEIRKKLWVIAVRRKNWQPAKQSFLCSQHFPEEMIDRTSMSCVRLRENAVPSIFDFPSHVQKEIKQRKLLTRSVFEPSHPSTEVQPAVNEPTHPKTEVQPAVNEPAHLKTEVQPAVNEPAHLKTEVQPAVNEPAHPNTEVQPGVNEVEPAAVGLELAGSSSESPTEAIYKRKVLELSNIIEEKNKKLKVLQQKVRRCEKKIKNMTELLARSYLMVEYECPENEQSAEMAEACFSK